MQFGWRLFIFCTFAFSVYAAYLLSKYFNARWQNTYIILALFIACYTIGPRYIYQIYLDHKGLEYIEVINPEFYEHYIIQYSPNSGDNLYLPQGVYLYLYEQRGEAVICNHEDTAFDFIRQDGKCYISVTYNPHNDSRLELPLYYYKGYQAVDRNTRKTLEVTSSKSKLVEVSLGNMQQANLVIWYEGTSIQKISDQISVFTLLAILLSQIAIRLRRK